MSLLTGWTRSPRVRSAAVAAVAAGVRFALQTIRWTAEGEEQVLPLVNSGQGVIVCYWHASLALSPMAWRQEWRDAQPVGALISRSRDGQLIADVVERMGVTVIRGSRAASAERAGDKRGAGALRDMARWVNGGGVIVITPDGPRGPARVMSEGPFQLARLTGAPVVLLGFAARPALRLRTWDTMWLPLPFGRGACVVDGPHQVARDDDADATVADWQTRLNAANARAEALVA